MIYNETGFQTTVLLNNQDIDIKVKFDMKRQTSEIYYKDSHMIRYDLQQKLEQNHSSISL